jgi:predicted transcriptional regulator
MVIQTEKELYNKIKTLSNSKRFEIYQLILKLNNINITTISQKVNLSYDKTREYITKLEKQNLIQKEKIGRETYIKPKYTIKFKEI